MTHNDAPQSVGLLWTRDQFVAKTYLTTHNIHNRQTSMSLVGFEPTISAGEWPQTHALDRAATGTGFIIYIYLFIYLFIYLYTLFKKPRLRLEDDTKINFRKWDGHPIPLPESNEVTGQWWRLHREELYDLYCSPNIVRVIKWRRMAWTVHVARMGNTIGVHRVLVKRPDRKRSLEKPRIR